MEQGERVLTDAEIVEAWEYAKDTFTARVIEREDRNIAIVDLHTEGLETVVRVKADHAIDQLGRPAIKNVLRSIGPGQDQE